MNASKIRQDVNYWREKLAAFLHDPPDKALSIERHKERVESLKTKLKVSAENKIVEKADQVASGLDRTFLPGWQSGGLIQFPKTPYITHPTGQVDSFYLGALETREDEIEKLILEDKTKFSKADSLKDFALFHYFRHVLPYRLWKENIYHLSWRWNVLPADTRLPDHSIWQHCALTSALYSCYKLSPEGHASLMVFSITPVQDFIARSRKLRDYWTASLVLSWLASEGLWAVICRYGSDHIIYPSPIGQALIEARFDETCGFKKWTLRYQKEVHAATLPNKFLFLVPTGEEEETAKAIEVAIKDAWLALAREVKKQVKNEAFKDVPATCLKAFDRIFDRQIEHFWEFHWTAGPLLDESTMEQITNFLPKESLVEPLKEYLKKAREHKLPYLARTEKFFYPASYDLIRRGLLVEKLSPVNRRPDEPGIKCHLHPDLEALRFSCLECAEAGKIQCELNSGQKPDPNPRPTQDPCWQKIRKAFSKTDFKQTERLSAIALIKRLAYRAVPEGQALYPFFEDARKERFPSTTEIALSEWFEKVQEDLKGFSLKDIAEFLHRQERSKYEKDDYEIKTLDNSKVELIKKFITSFPKENHPQIYDRYYTILVMDGDRMGKLLSGGFAARWRDVLHPELRNRFEEKKISQNFIEFWQDFLNCKRTLSPAVHGAISQALANFALYTVPYWAKKYNGTLIYAGGDDVCAVFPVTRAVRAALNIAEAYNWAFVTFREIPSLLIKKGEASTEKHPEVKEIRNASEIGENDLFLFHLGPGEEISISGGLLIVHHKWPLRAAIQRAHELLKLAKDLGRCALALELHRRAGERRTFVAGFRDTVKFGKEEILVWEAFNALVQAFASRKLSSSFAYRLQELAEGLEALSESPEKVARLIKSQIKVEKEINDSELQVLARNVTAILLGRRKKEKEGTQLAFEAIEIARFLGEAWRHRESHSA